MTPPLPTGSLSEADLEARRAALRRGLGRANTAAAVILLIVIGLALAAVWQAAKARRHATRADRSALEAEAATRQAKEELRKAQFAKARAARVSGVIGRRAESLAALRAAAEGRPSLELRNEAIATLALIDLYEFWFQTTDVVSPAPPAFDEALTHYAVSLSPGEVVVHRIADGAEAARLRGPARRIFHLAFSPDGQFLSARFRTGRRLVWELAGGAVVIDTKFAQQQRADTTAFSRDSQWFAAGAPDGTLHFYQRAEPGRPWRKLDPLATDALCFALDPRMERLLLARGRTVEIRRREDGALLTTQVFDQEITKLAWHPDGRSCVAGQINGLLLQWNADSTNAYAMSGHTAPLTHLEFNHRGDWLVTASEDGSTRLWAPGSRYSTLVSRDGLALGFSHDDRRIAFVRPGEGVGIWEISGGVEFRSVALPDSGQIATHTVDFAPDGRWLVAASPKHLTFWNVTGAELHSLIRVDGCTTAHFDAVGQAVITTGNQGVELRSVELAANGGVSLGPPEPVFTRRTIRRVNVTRGENEWLAVGGISPMLVDLAATGMPRELNGVSRQEFVTLSPDGRWLVGSEGTKKGTYLWNLETIHEERELDARGGPMSFSPNGDSLVIGGDQEYVAFDTSTWQMRWQVARQSAMAVGGVSVFSRDGALLALNPQRDRIRLVDPQTGDELATLTAPAPKNITSLAFNRSGDFLAARVENREIHVWNLREIRRQLAEMGLDVPASAAGVKAPVVQGLNIASNTASLASAIPVPDASASNKNSSWQTALPLGGAVLALGFGFYTFRYQRRLVHSYDEVERLVGERNRALQQAQADLWHSQKMKALGTLAAGIAHDFNNLLSVIRLSNDFLGRSVAGNPDLIEESQAIEQAVLQGKSVVESMLGYSRSQTDQPESLRVPDVVEETLGLLSQQFLSGTRLTMELDRETPPVMLSRGRLAQILLNLIVNAAEAMNGAGHLTITVRTLGALPEAGLVLAPTKAASYVELAVADSGPGIPLDVLPRIFEPFYTTKNVGTIRGTGLGLSMIYTAAQSDGLGLAVETVLGRGTVFRVVIPNHKSSIKSPLTPGM